MMKVDQLSHRALGDVVGVDEGSTVQEAAHALVAEEVGALFVYTATGVVGVFSERDLARAISDGIDPESTPVEEYMTEAPLTIEFDADVDRAAEMMSEYGLRHLAVARKGQIVGMLSMRDLIVR